VPSPRAEQRVAEKDNRLREGSEDHRKPNTHHVLASIARSRKKTAKPYPSARRRVDKGKANATKTANIDASRPRQSNRTQSGNQRGKSVHVPRGLVADHPDEKGFKGWLLRRVD